MLNRPRWRLTSRLCPRAAQRLVREGCEPLPHIRRRQGATLFEPRAALDDFELRGEPARAGLAAAVSRMPTDSTMPELARARDVLATVAPPLPGTSQ
jgi:hypothetical protein